MNSEIALPYQASKDTLLRATIAAATGAAAALVLFVLPAEYGVDLTGVGGALGLTALSGEAAEDAEPVVAAAEPAAQAVAVGPQTKETIHRATSYRADERTVTLEPHSGIELKARMQTGDSLVFQWRATGPVKMDMHGERAASSEDFSTYWKQKGLGEAQGTFTAPFTGTHGWYWRNQGETPVTITLKTSGFYQELFEPKAE